MAIAARPLTGPEAVALVTGAIRVETAPPLRPLPVGPEPNGSVR